METGNSSVIPEEAVLARLGGLIDKLNNYDQFVGKLMDDIEVNCVSPFSIPNWPRNLHMKEPIIIRRKEILYPGRVLSGINLTKILANIRVDIYSDGCLRIFTEQIQNELFKFLDIILGEKKTLSLKTYQSAARIYMGGEFGGLEDNCPQNIACCLIIFCQIIDEVCEGIEKELEKQLKKNGQIAEQCRGVPATVKRCFEPLIPYVMADALAQERS